MSKIGRVLDKGRQVVDLSKINLKIENETANIEKLYANLGRVFYKINPLAPDVVYEDLFRTINGCEQQLAYLKREAKTISNRGKCGQCGNLMAVKDLFCAMCGEKSTPEIISFES